MLREALVKLCGGGAEDQKTVGRLVFPLPIVFCILLPIFQDGSRDSLVELFYSEPASFLSYPLVGVGSACGVIGSLVNRLMGKYVLWSALERELCWTVLP